MELVQAAEKQKAEPLGCLERKGGVRICNN